MVGLDPISSGQLTKDEIERCSGDPEARLAIAKSDLPEPKAKPKGARYTPVSKRQDRPAAILWLVKFHPELTDGQISKLVGTTKPTIQAIRDRTHWNITNIQPVDPVALGLTKQTELDAAVQKAAKKKEAEGSVMSDDERRKLVSTEQSLEMETEPRIPTAISGLETFSLTDEDPRGEEEKEDDLPDADSLYFYRIDLEEVAGEYDKISPLASL